ncbi:hypothetical protein AB4455_09850 [Vibrio sp. 10N.261.46.E12]|uniref:hypothetical protein n=1 Tax=unclassified Vibrio TaxID=2614977 RepID=UPI0009788B6D|nr:MULTISPECIES: hypothetical protein [unclassified Vibrio]OMO37349.1 hypothetical protein BH584_23395 [Vibrio sp. 10N.261.45.E1]PMJ21948.1 hypothetical protein BCU27_17275 [Vibrio sp. 10N.286.45.B6]PML90588.1 hypothetical protein BCT66_04870 [Vibrio sp. 10N.261.49.E11]PMM72099.1 hypothetical protein BCT48_07450 [Vibrio sp. 10N.261.46.F12]PMM80658.1 hypothetical protein BCT46_17720 [Vibrio sp. 10N.261.46.E8]
MFYSKELNKGLLLILGVISAFIVFTSDSSYGALFALSINVLIAILFFSMTIELKSDILTWCFGFGFVRKTVKVFDIVDISFYQTKWYQGIGIRMLSDGWLYNASIGSALKLSLSNGKHVYIGCKKTDGLKLALKTANEQITQK